MTRVLMGNNCSIGVAASGPRADLGARACDPRGCRDGMAGPLSGEMRRPGAVPLQFPQTRNIQNLPTLTFVIYAQPPLPPASYILSVSPGSCRLSQWAQDQG